MIAKTIQHKVSPLKYLVYQKHNKHCFRQEECFLILSRNNQSERAVMYCNPEEVYRKDMGWVQSLFISYLNTGENSGKGLGTMLLDIARQYSQEMGLGGRFHLEAGSLYNSEQVPHIFYRKYGMNTGRPSIDRKMDSFVRKRKKATNLDFKIMPMFYPPIEYDVKAKTSFFENVKKRFLAYFKI